MLTKNPSRFLPYVFAALFLIVCNACCPSGVWEDEFDNLYQMVTLRNEDTALLETRGTMDTGQFGCGVWSIEPLTDAATYCPVTAENPDPVSWAAINPMSQETLLNTHCCSLFRFCGQSLPTPSGDCSMVVGTYESSGTYCTNQSGTLVLTVMQ